MSSMYARAIKLLRRRVFRNGALSLAQSLVGISTYFLVMRFVVTIVGLQGVGLWSLTMGFVAMIRILDLTGSNGLARMVGINYEDKDRYASMIDSMSVFIFLFYVLLALVAYYPLQNAILVTVEPETGLTAQKLLTWAMIALPINVVGMAQLSAIDGIGRADIRSVLNIFGFFVYGVLSVILIPTNGIIGLAYAQVIQYLLMLLSARSVLVFKVSPLRIIPVHLSRSAALVPLQYGIRLQASTIPLALFDSLTRILLGKWAGLHFLGIYDLSYKMALYTRVMIQASVNPLVPEFARLWTRDTTAAKVYYAGVNMRTFRAVAIAFSLLILASPVFSFFLLEQISPKFIFTVSVLSLGWGLASFGLITQLYARAAGILRWSIFGQWTLLVLGVALVYFSVQACNTIYVPIAVAMSVAVGHIVAFIGETRVLLLSPIGEDQDSRLSKFLFIGFLALGLAVAMFTFYCLL